MESPLRDITPPRDLTTPKYFTLDFFIYPYEEGDLKNNIAIFDLSSSINNYIYANNPTKLGELFAVISRIYRIFLAKSLTVKYNTLTGEKEIDERDYFKSPEEFDEELEEILDNARNGDILLIGDSDPIFIYKENNELFGEQFYHYQEYTEYFLPSPAISAIEEYEISSYRDVNELYPEINISGIYVPISYLPESENPEEDRESIPYLFGDENDSDLIIEMNKGHLLYLRSIPTFTSEYI